MKFPALIRVRCSECKEEHFIEMIHIGTEIEDRSIGYESEHIFRGELKCQHCNEDMRLVTTIYEYPNGRYSFYDIKGKSCTSMDDIEILCRKVIKYGI